jgi:two-component system sensor histidine kinase SenX3
MDWAVALGVASGMLAGAGAVVLGFRLRAHAADAGPGDGRTAITTETRDPRGGLARKSLDSLRVGVVVLDGDDSPVLVNPSARAMGLLRAGAEPGSIAAHPVVRTLAAQVRRSGVRREAELDLPRSGEAGTAEPLGVLLRAVGLGGAYVAVEAADVTESHRLDRVRRDFVANVGHELKTPIGALQLLSEALLDATGTAPEGREAALAARRSLAQSAPGEGEPPAHDPAEDVAAARRFAERIHHESTRLGRLVTELLELSRVQGAEPLPERTPVSVDWLVAEVLDRARTGAAAKHIEVKVSGLEGLTVYGSGNQLATALTNLVGNAVAYSPEHSEVLIACRGETEYVEIAVTDRGIGIAPKELDRIFERFYRSDRARSRATGGTGLGLAIVKHIATNHGGRVDVSSRLGEGSTFTLRLPARRPDAPMVIPDPDEIDDGGRVGAGGTASGQRASAG